MSGLAEAQHQQLSTGVSDTYNRLLLTFATLDNQSLTSITCCWMMERGLPGFLAVTRVSLTGSHWPVVGAVP